MNSDKIKKFAEEVVENYRTYTTVDEISESIEVEHDKLGKIIIEASGEGYWGDELKIFLELLVEIQNEFRVVHTYTIPANDKLTAEKIEEAAIEMIDRYSMFRNAEKKKEKRRKYERGEKITSLEEMVKQDCIYCNDKVTHRSWFMSWQINMAVNSIAAGRIYYAIRKEGEDGKHES